MFKEKKIVRVPSGAQARSFHTHFPESSNERALANTLAKTLPQCGKQATSSGQPVHSAACGGAWYFQLPLYVEAKRIYPPPPYGILCSTVHMQVGHASLDCAFSPST